MPSIEQLLKQATLQLADIHESAQLDAEVLLAHVLEKDRSYLRAWPERTISTEELSRYKTLLTRRAAGEPIAHLTGWREFWSLQLAVTADTLIPRPETEHLVELALEKIPLNTRWQIADLGTGSGAIALAIASERPECTLVATDQSEAALAVARNNAKRLGLNNIEFRQGDWLAPLKEQKFELIVSNPPYIPETDPHLQLGDVRFEPQSALTSGKQGLDDIETIARESRQHLKPGGWLIIEHGYDQGVEARAILESLSYHHVSTGRDLQGQDRLVLGQWQQK